MTTVTINRVLDDLVTLEPGESYSFVVEKQVHQRVARVTLCRNIDTRSLDMSITQSENKADIVLTNVSDDSICLKGKIGTVKLFTPVTIKMERINDDAILPVFNGVEYELFALRNYDVCTSCLSVIQTGVRIVVQDGYYGKIETETMLACGGINIITRTLRNYGDDVAVVVSNLGKEQYTIKKGQKIAYVRIRKITESVVI